MLDISVDLSPLLDIPYDLTSAMEEAMDELTYDFEQNLINNASSILGSSKDDYVDSVYRDYDGEGTWSVGIRGSWLASAIEGGSDPIDLKVGFSKNAKSSKDGGWYADIPFRHKTSRASNEMKGFASKMPSAVYKAALASAKSGVRLNSAGVPLSNVKPYRSTYSTKQIYSGMFRTKMSGRSAWFTIRRVSDKSPSGSWIHPGFSARNIIPMTLQMFNVEQRFNQLMSK